MGYQIFQRYMIVWGSTHTPLMCKDSTTLPLHMYQCLMQLEFHQTSALSLSSSFKATYSLSCSIWTNNQCQRLLELNDTRLKMGIATDPLNLHLL